MEQILLYNLSSKKEEQVRKLCSSLQILTKSISPRQFLEPIGALGGIKGIDLIGIENALPAFTDEMMLFVDFDDQTLWDFLSLYRQAEIEKVELKAGLTPHNLMWNSIRLHKELKAEHDELTKP